MEEKSGSLRQSISNRRREDERNQMAIDMAQNLSESQISHSNGGVHEDEMVVNAEVTRESSTEQAVMSGGPEATENQLEGRSCNIQRTRNLSDSTLQQTSNAAVATENQVKMEDGRRKEKTSRHRTKSARNPQGRGHYVQLASDIGPFLSGIKVPQSKDEVRVTRREEQSKKARESPHERASECRKEIRESVPHQEFLSEYNGDAVCGSSCSNCEEVSEPYLAMDRWDRTANEEFDSFNFSFSSCQAAECADTGQQVEAYRVLSVSSDGCLEETTNPACEFQLRQGSSTGELSQRSAQENTSCDVLEEEVEKFYEEPSTKKVKRDPEVKSKEASLSAVCSVHLRTAHSSAELMPTQGSRVVSEQYESMSSPGNLSRAGSSDSPTSYLGAEFQSLNLADSNLNGAPIFSSVSVSYSSVFPQAESSQNAFSTGSSSRSEQDRSLYDSSDAGATSISRSGVLDITSAGPSTSMTEEVDACPQKNRSAVGTVQGAQSNTAQQARKPKPKTRKKKKGSYAQLAEGIAGDVRAMNRQLEKPHVANNRFQRHEEDSVGHDGQNSHVWTGDNATRGASALPTEASNSASLEDSNPAQGQVDPQSVQNVADSMAPQLQALVIQMMQQDEDREGIHIFNGVRLNQPDPSRVHPLRAREGVPQEHGDCADQRPCVEGASKQTQTNKKAKKGSKKKNHYSEIAELMAPELAVMNRTLSNEQQGRHQQSVSTENRRGNLVDEEVHQMVHDARSSHSRQSRPLEAPPDVLRDTTPILGQCTNQGEGTNAYWTSPRSTAYSERRTLPLGENLATMPHEGEIKRNGQQINRNQDGRLNGASGQNNRSKAGKQKKKRQDGNNENTCSHLAESLSAPLAALNAQLEQHQRQQRHAERRHPRMNANLENIRPSDESRSVTEDSITSGNESVTSSERSVMLSHNPSEHDDSSLAES